MTINQPFRLACDSLVALGNSTADGSVLFAKNSDRPAGECQPLVQLARTGHAHGTTVGCTYIEIPQVTETARVVGSRPIWCWGFEHGLNEYGVAIGNHTVFTKDGLAGEGLIGMDLVRLGLERARNVDEAATVITALLERYGQGGSGYSDKDWPYHNSFLIADRTGACVLETSDRHWALRRVTDVASATNHLTIGSDWDAISDGAIEHAVAEGWWSEDSGQRFSFAAAYRDTSMVPEFTSSGRHQRTCHLLAENRERLGADDLRTALRDHYGQATPRLDLPVDCPEYFSVCMHADPAGTTTASMIARIPPAADEPLLYWASLGSPCIGVFIPLFVDCVIPEILTHGSVEPSADSPWWRFKDLLTLVEQDWPRNAAMVRSGFDPLEAEISERMRRERVASHSVAVRESFMQKTVDDMLQRVDDVSSALRRNA